MCSGERKDASPYFLLVVEYSVRCGGVREYSVRCGGV